ncbi:MAG: hypothetical protein KAI29_16120, partial [Cyclobacteriaceae bacterium]|nr:hypothetical protein [Cyclobacteriaceae bacterium]
MPSFIILFFIFTSHENTATYSRWTWSWFVFAILLLIAAISDHIDFKRQWLCSKCGEKFIPTSRKYKKM